MLRKNIISTTKPSYKTVKGRIDKACTQGIPVNCMCPNCGAKAPNTHRISCMTMICSRCGSQMMRT